MSDDIQATIRDIVTTHKLVIFMKGNPSFPMCGFSQATSGLLHSLGYPVKAVDVIADAAFRQGIKTYTEWPTIPQIFIDGEFVGGCDIVHEMHRNGELETAVKTAFTEA